MTVCAILTLISMGERGREYCSTGVVSILGRLDGGKDDGPGWYGKRSECDCFLPEGRINNKYTVSW